MQVSVGSANIDIFRFAANFDVYNRRVTFDTSLSTYNGSSGSGIFNVLGISFLLMDQDNVVLAEIDFTDASKYIVPSVTQEFEVDLSSLPYAFLFQTYKIQGAIKDADGNIYYTTPAYYKICQPTGLTESGYVPGTFQVISNCVDNVLTVKELTKLVYDGKEYDSVSKAGTLYYPTGTVSSVPFTGTPFSNNVIYTGQYRVNCTTVATYDMGDDVYVLVSYITANVFNITCANRIADLICCMVDLQATALKNCNNAIGKNAQQKLNEVAIPFMIGLTKEINGQDASIEAEIIRKALNCDCGSSSVLQNEFTPINPSVTNIVLTGAGGTTVGDPTINGSTKTYAITSSNFQITKGDTGDLAFTITTDTSTSNVIKYKIKFNYTYIAQYVLTAIGNSGALTAALNALITQAGLNLSGLDGKCIQLGDCDYVYLKQGMDADTRVDKITINGTDYSAPVNTYVGSGASPIQTWLNSLGLGTFSVTVDDSNFYSLLIQSDDNPNTVSSLTTDLGGDLTTQAFIPTCENLASILQAIIDYLCELTALQVALGANLTIWQLDYNGEPSPTAVNAGNSQAVFKSAVADAIYNIITRISTLTGITCAKLAAVMIDRADSVFSGNQARVFGIDNEGNCISYTREQLAKGVMNAINDYAAVKAIFCAVDCEEPATCPDISNISLAMVGSAIGVYGLTWATTPLAAQTVIVKYKLSSSSTWLTATSGLVILPNGNISGTTPFQIPGVTAGQTYDIQIVNDCGGTGFTKQITTPTGTVYPGSYLLESSLYLICGVSPVTLYSSEPFGAGVIMYSDAALTVPVTGYSYIADNATGDIYTMNGSTGAVIVSTGTSCSNGIARALSLSNNTGTICTTNRTTLYVNGSGSLIGKTLYLDAALTTPVTGYSYVLDTEDEDAPIYNLNSVTGVVGSVTGLSCGVFASEFKIGNSEGAACIAGNTTLYSSNYYAIGEILYTDAALTTPLTGYSIVADYSGILYNVDPTTGEITSLTGNAC
jgi:hypothetical protein